MTAEVREEGKLAVNYVKTEDKIIPRWFKGLCKDPTCEGEQKAACYVLSSLECHIKKVDI